MYVLLECFGICTCDVSVSGMQFVDFYIFITQFCDHNTSKSYFGCWQISVLAGRRFALTDLQADSRAISSAYK